MKAIDLSLPKGAIFSHRRRYRYALWRIWNPQKPLLLFIGLNPSTANELEDDPTITRNQRRAYQQGFGGLLCANLFAFVSTNPQVLLQLENTVGEYTDYYIEAMVKLSSSQLCGWGSFPAASRRASIVYSMMSKPVCLSINADGEPGHPLYISYDKPLQEYRR